MTLSRQFIALLVLMFILVFSGNFWSVLSNTREYLSQQMESHAQDGATSLGLSLAPYTDSMPVMESMIDAIFDSGNYSDIRLVDLDGKLVLNRHNNIRAQVPHWFSSLFPLETPEAETLITTGWQQKFHLHVMSDPSYAYSDLWTTAIDTVTWTMEAFALALLLAILLIRLILRPLRAVEVHADRICNKEFPGLLSVPRTRDLARVVGAINRMSTKVKSMVDDLTKTAEMLRSDLNNDTLTGLLNRNGIIAVVSQHKTDESLPSQGYFAMISVSGLQELNVKEGYSAGDGAISLSAEIIERTCKGESFPDSIFARIGGSDFAFLMPGADREMVESPIVGFCNELNSRLVRYNAGLSVHIGVIEYNKKMDFGELCKLADGPLSSAQFQRTDKHFCFAEPESIDGESRGKQDWYGIINGALENDNILMGLHQIQFISEEEETSGLYEVCTKISDDDGNSIPAGDFIFWAERLNLIESLDKRVIKLSLGWLAQEVTMRLSVNISEISLHSDDFMKWLGQTLRANQKLANRLLFELPEKGILGHLDKAIKFVEISKKYKVKIVIDRFGASHSPIDYLRKVSPEFIKIDGSYILDIENDTEDQVMLKAYVDIAHGLDIKVIATFVETKEARAVVEEQGVDAVQGRLLGPPI